MAFKKTTTSEKIQPLQSTENTRCFKCGGEAIYGGLCSKCRDK